MQFMFKSFPCWKNPVFRDILAILFTGVLLNIFEVELFDSLTVSKTKIPENDATTTSKFIVLEVDFFLFFFLSPTF